MPAGRPTKYDPAYCDQIIDFMAQGYSITAFAGSIRVARSSVYLWAEEHPEFSDAIKIAEAAAAVWWEDRLRSNATEGVGNATACVFGLKNRARDDWRDRREHDHSNTDGTLTGLFESIAARGKTINDDAG